MAIYYCYLLLAQATIAVAIVLSKLLLTAVSAHSILLCRYIIATLFLLLFHVAGKHQSLKRELSALDRKAWLIIIIQALCAGIFFNYLVLFGLQYTNASSAGIITSALPAIIAVASVFILKERFTWFNGLCVLLAVLGLVAINFQNIHFNEEGEIFGDFLILLSLVPEAAYYILARVYRNALSVTLVASIMNGINALVLIIITLLVPTSLQINLNSSVIGLLLILGIASSGFYLFWFMGCNHVKASAAGLTTAIVPIATLLLARVVLQDEITILQLAGMFLIIGAIFANAKARANK